MKDLTGWKENFNKLKAYHRKHRNFDVLSQRDNDKRLSAWVENIRKYPKRLSAKQYKELVKIGFDFDSPSDWNAMFYRLEEFHKKHGHSYVPSNQKKYESLFDWTQNQRRAKSLLTPTQLRKLDSLQFEWEGLVDRDVKWEQMYQELLLFKQKYGHTKVPQDFKESKTLGGWVSKQRSNRTKKRLQAERIRKLNSIGFLWKEDIIRMREEAWKKRYTELVRYKDLHGHIDRIKVRNDNYQLGLWIETQIVRQNALSPDRKKKLNAIGFRWEKEDYAEERWNEMYNRLKAYKKKHGHCRVKQREDFKLAVWIQRNKRDKEKIAKDKKKKLDDLGVKWPYELFRETWQTMYTELKNFRKVNKHVVVPRSDPRLYEWIQTQKKLKAEAKLSKDREEKLVKLGFIWKGDAEATKRKSWEAMYNKFKAFKERHGSKYHIKLKEHPELDEWVSLQLHSKNKLSSFKRDKLDAIHFLWNRSGHYWDERWERKYEQLVAFKSKHGHCDVPQKYPPNQALASWVNGQRTKQLSAEKKKKLNVLGFSWRREIEQRRWLQRVKEFIDFKKENGSLSIPHHTPLYSWRYQQKKNFHKLTVEKRRILKRAGIV